MAINIRNFITRIGQFVSGGTSGGVLFTDSSGNLAQSLGANQQLFWDNSNFRLGVRTATPSQSFHVAASAIIGTQLVVGSTSLDASAVLSVVSANKGFLPPVMSTTAKNAISTPTEGLMVYDLTLHKLCVFTGSVWETVTSI